MKNRIILFAIGSVQNYIISSRKTVDLYNGSSILSDLIKQGIKFFNEYSRDVILPCSDINTKNMPNYFMLKYESEKSLGLKLESYIKKYYFEQFHNNLEEEVSDILIAQIRRQLKAALDIYWVDYELEENEDFYNEHDYEEIYNKVYQYFDGAKNYKQIKSNNEEGKKCTICGKRNAIFVNKGSNKKPQYIYEYEGIKAEGFFSLLKKLEVNNIKDIQPSIIKKNKKANVVETFRSLHNEKEMLCSECYLKRIYDKKEYKGKIKIPSTAEIAVSSWLRKAEAYEEADRYKQYIDSFDYFFRTLQKDNMLENFDKYSFIYPEVWKNIKLGEKEDEECIKQLEIAFKRIKNKNINKYYCIYRLDIDNLGKWMSGKYKKDGSLRGYQKKLSDSIDDFFNSIRAEISDIRDALLVYAGGDDMMALLPVDMVLKFIRIVKKEFSDKVSKDAYNKITYSEGIFMAHYKAPLSEVVRISKDELENAKNRFKEKRNYYDIPKNATVISIMSGMNDSRNLYYKKNTEYIKGNSEVGASEFIFEYLLNKFNEDFTYFHNQLEIEFMDFDKNLNGMLECAELVEMIAIEQKRLIGRSVIKHNIYDGDKKLKLDEDKDTERTLAITELHSNLIDFLKENCKNIDTVDMENYFNVFHIVRKLNSIMGEGESVEGIANKA